MYYEAFGLSVRSEIPLPELLEIKDKRDRFDIHIMEADLTELWTKEVEPPQKFLANNNRLLYKIKNVGIFSIEKGKEIVVSPFKGADVNVIRLYILGTCMGIILLQRNFLPLHGSAIAINGKAYAFVGDSGAGKSTLASVFLKQ